VNWTKDARLLRRWQTGNAREHAFALASSRCPSSTAGVVFGALWVKTKVFGPMRTKKERRFVFTHITHGGV